MASKLFFRYIGEPNNCRTLFKRALNAVKDYPGENTLPKYLETSRKDLECLDSI